MLGLGRYALGVAEIGLLACLAWLGGSALRRRLAPTLEGAPATLATLVLAIALLLLAAELLGSFGAFESLPYLVLVGAAGVALWWSLPRVARVERGRERTLGPPAGPSRSGPGPAGRNTQLPTLIALAIATLAVLHFAQGVHQRLGTGMTGFDSTWYHAPFAAGFFQSGDTWSVHHIAPQFLAWFYPANAEVAHAVGMLSFDRDLISPFLNLGWMLACLLAAWCVGRPFGVAPWSLALVAVALSVPALGDQAGEARNDLAGTFFLLAAAATALCASTAGDRSGRLPTGGLLIAGLCAGLAAGTKLGFVMPAAVFVGGLALAAAPGRRRRALGATAGAALIGGGYWYLRNLAHTGNPLPWFDSIGPISLPAPEQALGGREQHSVAGYLTDGHVWSEWFLPGLHHGLTVLWPLLLVVAVAGLVLAVGRRATPAQRVSGLAGLAAVLAWLVAPTSASGPDGMPHGFESGLRYLAPALALGLALLPTALPGRLRELLPTARSREAAPTAGPQEAGMGRPSNRRILKAPRSLTRRLSGRGMSRVYLVVLAFLVAAAIGYPVQRNYLRDRYAHPTFTTPGLDAAFAWSRDLSGARIATTSTRQYPLFGTDLSNEVRFVGEDRPHGGFVAPSDCSAWRRLLAEGEYDYVVASRDRIEPGRPPYPATARWTEGPGAKVVLRKPPTVVFKLTAAPDPSGCPR